MYSLLCIVLLSSLTRRRNEKREILHRTSPEHLLTVGCSCRRGFDGGAKGSVVTPFRLLSFSCSVPMGVPTLSVSSPRYHSPCSLSRPVESLNSATSIGRPREYFAVELNGFYHIRFLSLLGPSKPSGGSLFSRTGSFLFSFLKNGTMKAFCAATELAKDAENSTNDSCE